VLTSLFERVCRRATWTNLAIVLAAGIVAMLLFRVRNQKLGGNLSLDGRPYYDLDGVRDLFAKLAAIGRLQLYAISEVTLDLVFPFLYGSFFAMLIARLYDTDHAWLLSAPLVSLVADLTENVTIALLAFTAPATPSAALVTLASSATQTKRVMILMSALIIIAGALRRLIRAGKAGRERVDG
jgi:hypothetical protein